MADEQKTDTVETATTESKQEEVKQEEVVNTGFSAEQVEEKIKERLARERRKIYKELGTEDLNIALICFSL